MRKKGGEAGRSGAETARRGTGKAIRRRYAPQAKPTEGEGPATRRSRRRKRALCPARARKRPVAGDGARWAEGSRRVVEGLNKRRSMRWEGVTVFSRDLSYFWYEVLAHLAYASPHRRTVGYYTVKAP